MLFPYQLVGNSSLSCLSDKLIMQIKKYLLLAIALEWKQ